MNKTSLKFDIGIDDRAINLGNCDKKLLFTEFRNMELTAKELEDNKMIRVNNWLDVRKELL